LSSGISDDAKSVFYCLKFHILIFSTFLNVSNNLPIRVAPVHGLNQHQGIVPFQSSDFSLEKQQLYFDYFAPSIRRLFFESLQSAL
jgi:hypothetical protein